MKKAIFVSAATLTVIGVLVYGWRCSMQVKQEKSSMANLGMLRSSIEMYIIDHKTPPSNLERELVPKYISRIPTFSVTPKQHLLPSKKIDYVNNLNAVDTGHWAYVSDPGSKDFGKIFVNCTHLNYKQQPWWSQ
jgi:hypothetical protein